MFIKSIQPPDYNFYVSRNIFQIFYLIRFNDLLRIEERRKTVLIHPKISNKKQFQLDNWEEHTIVC